VISVGRKPSAWSTPLPSGAKAERIEIGDVILIDVVQPGGPTAIVFSAVNSNSFSYYKLFSGLTVNRIYVRDPWNLWYQQGVSAELSSPDALAAYLRDVLDRINPSRTLAFGSSMGGYASLLFGHLLELDAVVAICPQTLLDHRLPHTPAEPASGAYADLAEVLPTAPAHDHYVFLGAADVVDIYNVFRLAHGSMRLLPIAGQDHMVMHHLMKNGEFERCVRAIFDDVPYVCETPLDERCRDPLVRGVVERLVEGFYRDGPWDPERYARALLSLEPDWPAANYMLARVWEREERLDDAMKQAARAANRAPGSITFADFKAQLFLRQKMYDEALDAYERCIAIRPKHYAALCALASLHARAGRRAQALGLLDEAIAIRPRHTRALRIRDGILSGEMAPVAADGAK
jgi:pimeloyl-ACP methyl ester carboxylesterase